LIWRENFGASVGEQLDAAQATEVSLGKLTEVAVTMTAILEEAV
jgi:hypothetical protein